MTITLGVLGGFWRADVTPAGAIRGWDGGISLDWWVAADDRWHDPAAEPSIRQIRLEGTPVVETRLRVPRGDAVQRVYAVADHGGYTVIEVENDSPLPIAVAFSGSALASQRPPADMPIEGINLPDGAVAFPVGHHATLTVAIAHTSGRGSLLPEGLSSSAHVVRGWLATCERASRLLLPDLALSAAVIAARCDLLLSGPDAAIDAPVDFLLGVGELIRMGSAAEPWIPEVSLAVERLAKHASDPFLTAALDAAERVCRAAGERRAVRDLARVRTLLVPEAPARADRSVDSAVDATSDTAQPSAARLITATERSIADGADLFPAGLPPTWLGQNFEVHEVPTSACSAVSLAIRWHGARPAVLWETSGEPMRLRASELAPEWSSDAPSGDTLWPAPTGAAQTTSPTVASPTVDGSVSFS